MDPNIIPVLGIAIPLSIPIIAIVTSHQRKMMEIRMRAGNLQSSVLDEVRTQLAAMREEIATLRDTSTKFDMSFDAALSRLEGRVDRIEENRAGVAASDAAPVAPSAPQNYPVAPVAADSDFQRLVVGQKG